MAVGGEHGIAEEREPQARRRSVGASGLLQTSSTIFSKNQHGRRGVHSCANLSQGELHKFKRLRDGGAIVIDTTLKDEAAGGMALSIPGDNHPTALANRMRAVILKNYLERNMAEVLASRFTWDKGIDCNLCKTVGGVGAPRDGP